MSLLFIDGFDHYDGVVSNLGIAGYTVVTNIALSTSFSRTGARSLSGTINGASSLVRPFSANYQTIGFGFGYYTTDLSTTKSIANLSRDDGTYDGSSNCTIHFSSSGQIRFTRQNAFSSGIIYTSQPGLITANVWNHLEFKITISNTVGRITCYVNGVLAFDATGLDTVYNGNETTAGISLSPRNTDFIDDFYIWDTNGSVNNTFLGDRKVVTLSPNDITGTAEWGVSGAASAITAMSSNDGDTSYIYAGSSVPVTSDFELSNPDATVGEIAGVQTVICARKVEAGTVTLQPSMVSGSSATNNGSHSITNSYKYYSLVHELNPATGAPWSASNLTTAKLRLKRTA